MLLVDPSIAMVGLAGAGALEAVAADAKERLTAALAALTASTQED
jgi:hypothetical protein